MGILNKSLPVTKKWQVECDFKTSEKCRNVYDVFKQCVPSMLDRNEGKIRCVQCYAQENGRSFRGKVIERNLKAVKYPHLKTDYFREIDTLEKAYFLGWIASDGSIRKSAFTIEIKDIDIKLLENIRDLICPDIPIGRRVARGTVVLNINSKEIASDLCRHLKIVPGKKSHTVQFPDLPTSDLTWAFLRGWFEGDGSISSPTGKHKHLQLTLCSSSRDFLESIVKFFSECSPIGKQKNALVLYVYGNKAIKFLRAIYRDIPLDIYLDRKYKTYLYWDNFFSEKEARIDRRKYIRECTICKITKNVSEFYKISGSQGRYASECKKCKHEKDRIRRLSKVYV